jgi:hypothetical protein
MRSLALSVGCVALIVGCEDGPDQVSLPLSAGPRPVETSAPDVFVPGDTHGFGDAVAEDDVGSAKFCAETEENALAREMVVQPIVPDVSAGGLPLWAGTGGALYADDVLGRRGDGKFCNPSGTFADAFTWGPTQDVILLFDPETRLVEGVIVTQQYLGAMQGVFTEVDGSKVDVVAKPRERLAVGGQELDLYASRAQALAEPRSWLNPANVTKLYRMVRETFFGAAELPEGFDCVAAQICDLIYTGANEDTPQDTVVALQDSGIQIGFTPEGYADFIYLTPVRSAPFENGGTIAFGAASVTAPLDPADPADPDDPGPADPDDPDDPDPADPDDPVPAGAEAPAPVAPVAPMTFSFQSQFREGCVLELDSALRWADFQSRCIVSGDERALDRVNYNVDTSRDAVSVEFNGINLHFMRDMTQGALFTDGERPGANDTLYSIGFSRTMPAAVSEFDPLVLGQLYKARLEARLAAAVLPGTEASEGHPFSAYSLTVPFTLSAPQRIGELLTPDGTSWLPTVIAEVQALHAALTPEERAVVDARVVEPVFLIEPFVDSVLFALSHGESDADGAVKAFRTTDDARWSIGSVSFRRAGMPYRLAVQYSLNFGAVTFVEVSRGDNLVDRVIELGRVAPVSPYYEAADMLGSNLVSLGSNGISVVGFDRRLGTLNVGVAGSSAAAELAVSGAPLEDVAGYSRQIRGQRFEFVPAHEVNLFGKENFMVAWVREDGTIGKLENRQFKGSLELCPGLPVAYGDDVQSLLLAWERTVSPEVYRDCDLVFNSSANGNVLIDISSIAYRRSFSVIDGRAINVSVWE